MNNITLASFFTICRFHLNGMLHLNQHTVMNAQDIFILFLHLHYRTNVKTAQKTQQTFGDWSLKVGSNT